MASIEILPSRANSINTKTLLPALRSLSLKVSSYQRVLAASIVSILCFLWRRYYRLRREHSQFSLESRSFSRRGVVTWDTPRAPARQVSRKQSNRDSRRPSVKSYRSQDSLNSEEREFGFPEDLFELGAKVSAGSQGTVYECVRLNTQQQYAAKVINCSLSSDSRKQMLLLKREICIMRELNHPKIVNVLVAFWADDSCTIVMDLARGGDLYAKLEYEVKLARDSHATFRGLGGDEFVSKYIAKQLLEGIGYMHMNHVVHRDLKLENVLITSSHSLPELEVPEVHDVKIADFGLSTVLNSINGKHCASLNLMMSAVGTPAYVAPEVLDESYDQSVDYWSFGVILYALNCGRMPFVISSLNPNRHKEAVSKLQKCDSWNLISVEGQSMIRGLLKVCPEERYNMKDCLHHPWLESSCLPTSGLNDFAPTAIRQLSLASTFSSDPGEGDIVGAIIRISGWTGNGLQGAELSLIDGSVMSFGEKDKTMLLSPKSPMSKKRNLHDSFDLHNASNTLYNSYDLEPDELVIGVVQSRSGTQSTLGDGLVFFTSRSRVLALEGTDARHRSRFVAPAGWQIVGLQFEGSVLKGTHVERVSSSGQGSVHFIKGTAGTVVESMTFEFRDGSALSYGTADVGSQSKQTSFKLKTTEVICIVEQGHVERGLGVSLVLYTSHGNVIKVAGVTFAKSLRFAAGLGQQICGLRFQGTSLSMVQTCSKSGALDTTCWHEAC